MHINIDSQQLCETRNYYQPCCRVRELKLNSLSSFWQQFAASTGNQIYAELCPRTLNRPGHRYDVTFLIWKPHETLLAFQAKENSKFMMAQSESKEHLLGEGMLRT